MGRFASLSLAALLAACGARTGLGGGVDAGAAERRPEAGTPEGGAPDGPDPDAGCVDEVCDGADQDCDGRVDEGVLGACRDCRPGCTLLELPGDVGPRWDTVATESEGVEVGADGGLRLAEDRSESTFAWIANTERATLTKLDLRNGAQLGEFDSALRDGRNGARPALERCDEEAGRGNCPSRTAVDLRGAVYVANRAFGNQGTVTKIAGRSEDCVDRDGDGRIDTSADLDGDGLIEFSEPGEYRGQEDECLLWTVDVGESGGLPRAVAIDAEGEVWVGLHEGREVLELDPATGATRRRVSLRSRGFSPYGASIASDGTLWLVEAVTGRIAAVDTRTAELTRLESIPVSTLRVDCGGSYGIALDGDDRVWLAGFQCEAVFRFDPRSDSWGAVELPDSGGTRGIAADDRGFVWIGSSHTEFRLGGPTGLIIGDPIARLTRVRDDLSEVRVFGLPGDELPGLGTVGVGLDPERRVWMVNQQSGTVTRFDPETGTAAEFPVGDTPYTYSDFTGFALRTFTAPSGFLRSVIDACPSGLGSFEELRWDADVPEGTRLEIRLRSAAERGDLAVALWVGPLATQPVDLTMLGLPRGRFLEVELALVSEGGRRSPNVRSVTVQVDCPL